MNVAVADPGAWPAAGGGLGDGGRGGGRARPSGRVLLRPSGTEPLVRVMVEAPTEEVAADAAERLCRGRRRRGPLGRACPDRLDGADADQGAAPSSLVAMCGIIGVTGSADACP